jgi:hypothetical protein
MVTRLSPGGGHNVETDGAMKAWAAHAAGACRAHGFFVVF